MVFSYNNPIFFEKIRFAFIGSIIFWVFEIPDIYKILEIKYINK